jgi:hypothetical protein
MRLRLANTGERTTEKAETNGTERQILHAGSPLAVVTTPNSTGLPSNQEKHSHFFRGMTVLLPLPRNAKNFRSRADGPGKVVHVGMTAIVKRYYLLK